MKKGISLVALIITIIVLVILAGTIILTSLNENIIGKAENARDERNKQEVYSAVQREVLNVQASKIGLDVSEEFATELQTRILKNHKTSNATATYNEGTDSISITFDLNKKTYNLTLDNKYRLTMNEDSSITLTEEELKFIEDLELSMENNYFSSNGYDGYDLEAIQNEMKEKYPESEYIYLILRDNGEEAYYYPAARDTTVEYFKDDSGYTALNSLLLTTKIKYKNVERFIEYTQVDLKDSLDYKIINYATDNEIKQLYKYSKDTITKYIGNEEKTTVPIAILPKYGNFASEINIIESYAFTLSTETATKVDLVTDVLGITYDQFNQTDIVTLVLAAEKISDISNSQYYEEGMTKEEYAERIVSASGGALYKEGEHYYSYMNSNQAFVTKPRTVVLKEVIIPQNIFPIIIEQNAFSDNGGIETIRINTKVNKISNGAFQRCDELKDIYMPLYTKAEVQALTNYSTDKWGAPNATIHCSDGDL